MLTTTDAFNQKTDELKYKRDYTQGLSSPLSHRPKLVITVL
jgi:hypothetical protein